MRASSFLVLCMLFFGIPNKSRVPTFTYTLHAQKEPRGWSLIEVPTPPSTVLAVTRAGALLVLIPQPARKWALKQLTGWNTASPTEQSLAVASSPVGRDEDVWIAGDLTVTGDDKYALVRITTRRRSPKPDVFNVEASITAVDLKTFSAASSRITTGPLIAGADWAFTSNSVLISSALMARVRTSAKGTSEVTDTYEAAILDLPELSASEKCDYTKILTLRDGQGWQAETEKTADAKCARVLAAANVATVNELPGKSHLAELAKGLQSLPSCNALDVSDDRELALYDCSKGHQAWDRVITTSRWLSVLSTAINTSVLTVTLPPKQPTKATLATADGQKYLIVVRDGIRVEAYRVGT